MFKKKIVFGWLLIFGFIIGLSGCTYSESDIEESAVSVVNQILHEQNNSDLDCEEVIITQAYDDNTYDAKATLSDSSVININIEYYPDKDNYVYVEIPY
ncbi:hypothetical protein GCM10025886_02350 [Tetragenococcus halophilus subsp. flandriensis]|uniref:hypothetical protein n=1 Tax=Tetragenococcus halophilus TaxID=51669 RepID=UPI0023E91562|nr:hypothetical protein [Tetragenococcus halophilus]GMA07084.1 hypothetical protein GCM10025886_02350 [Tetragenococcus halophilus subsp. flandriensis]